MDYLAICQRAVLESGTISGVNPTSVVAQTGRLQKFVVWVAAAWRQIQNKRSAWKWMRAEFTAQTSTGTARYTATAWNLTRFAEWVVTPPNTAFSIYLTATGVSDESLLSPISWEQYREVYVRGTQTNDRPIHWSISPANEFCIGPPADAAYTVRGEFRKSVQELTINTDEPECPARFHDVIAYYALLLMAEHDEAPNHIASAARNYMTLINGLERDQLPEVKIGAPPIGHDYESHF